MKMSRISKCKSCCTNKIIHYIDYQRKHLYCWSNTILLAVPLAPTPTNTCLNQPKLQTYCIWLFLAIVLWLQVHLHWYYLLCILSCILYGCLCVTMYKLPRPLPVRQLKFIRVFVWAANGNIIHKMSACTITRNPIQRLKSGIQYIISVSVLIQS